MSRKKADDRRQRHGETPQLTVVRVETRTVRPLAVPEPAKGWAAETVRAWGVFWRDGLAQLATPVDATAARRLFGMYDARAKLWRLALREPFAAGSTGQKRAHPAWALVFALDDRIARAERAFGITPAARAALGISFAEAKRSLADLARESADGVERAQER